MKSQQSNSAMSSKEQNYQLNGANSTKEGQQKRSDQLSSNDQSNQQNLLAKSKHQYTRHQSFKDSTNEEFKSTRIESQQSKQSTSGGGGAGGVPSRQNITSSNCTPSIGNSNGGDSQFYLPSLRQESDSQQLTLIAGNGSIPSQLSGASMMSQLEQQSLSQNAISQGGNGGLVMQQNLKSGGASNGGRMMMLGLNQQYPQIRSHSTEKQTSTFLSNLEGKANQLAGMQAFDDSSALMMSIGNGNKNMMTLHANGQGNSSVGGAQSNQQSHHINSQKSGGGQMSNQKRNNKFQQSSQQQYSTPQIPLPRTGIEQAFMKERQRFRQDHKEFEPIHCMNPLMAEEFARIDGERLSNPQNYSNKIVYDCIDPSPYYDFSDPQFEESDLIELPAEDTSTLDYRKYPYSPNVQGLQFQQNMNQRGIKLNRYYQKLKPYYILNSSNDTTLIFESRFESGNLRRAVQVGQFEYDLILKYDFSTTNYTQWFFFKISNTRKDITYKFNIINLIKPESSYNEGMKPLIYSTKTANYEQNYGWMRDGVNICYYQNSMKKKGGGTYHTLTFQTSFKYDDDDIYFAHCYPYTYSDCCEFLNKICTVDAKDKIRKTMLCKTLAGNDCEMVIITNFNSRPEEIAMRRAVILTSRVHPGESNASYIMHGTLEYLVSDDEGAQYLRNQFVFKIIPMLNPDGVIIGNYRCSLSGQDLNRQWIAPQHKLCPENFAVKLMMKKTLESRDILFFCDYHGHSRQKNLFMYGCSNQKIDRLKERIFPMLFHKNTEHFSFNNCNFVVQKAREATARVVMWKEFNLINSFTLECSFCGPTNGLYRDCHFTIGLLKELGKQFCLTLLDYARNEIKVRDVIQELEILFPPNKNEEGLTVQFNASTSLGSNNDNSGKSIEQPSSYGGGNNGGIGSNSNGNRSFKNQSYFGYQQDDDHGVIPSNSYEVVDPYEQKNAKYNGKEEGGIKEKGGKSKKKQQKGSNHQVKKQQSEMVGGSIGSNQQKNKLQGYQQNMSTNEGGGQNHLYRHSMSSDNMAGGGFINGLSGKDKEEYKNKGEKVKEGKKENGQGKKKGKKKAKQEEQEQQQQQQQQQMNASVKIQLPIVKVDNHNNGLSH